MRETSGWAERNVECNVKRLFIEGLFLSTTHKLITPNVSKIHKTLTPNVSKIHKVLTT